MAMNNTLTVAEANSVRTLRTTSSRLTGCGVSARCSRRRAVARTGGFDCAALVGVGVEVSASVRAFDATDVPPVRRAVALGTALDMAALDTVVLSTVVGVPAVDVAAFDVPVVEATAGLAAVDFGVVAFAVVSFAAVAGGGFAGVVGRD